MSATCPSCGSHNPHMSAGGRLCKDRFHDEQHVTDAQFAERVSRLFSEIDPPILPWQEHFVKQAMEGGLSNKLRVTVPRNNGRAEVKAAEALLYPPDLHRLYRERTQSEIARLFDVPESMIVPTKPPISLSELYDYASRVNRRSSIYLASATSVALRTRLYAEMHGEAAPTNNDLPFTLAGLRIIVDERVPEGKLYIVPETQQGHAQFEQALSALRRTRRRDRVIDHIRAIVAEVRDWLHYHLRRAR